MLTEVRKYQLNAKKGVSKNDSQSVSQKKVEKKIIRKKLIKKIFFKMSILSWDLICSFDNDHPNHFTWLNPPKILRQCECQGDCSECYDPVKGRAWITEHDHHLVIRPAAKTDYWCRTFYRPEYIKTNAPALVTSISSSENLTFQVDLCFKAISQFDQAVC